MEMRGTQPYTLPKKRRADAGTGMFPSFRLYSDTAQKVGMVTSQVTMHHGHSTFRTVTDCVMRKITRTSAATTPRLKSIQYHFANLAPARMPTPTAIVAVQPTSPSRGFGYPRSEPCQEERFVEQLTRMLKLQ